MKLLPLSRYVEKLCRLHLLVLQLLILLWPSKIFASDRLLKHFHLGQIWVAFSQNLEVSHAKEVLGLKVIWLSKQVMDLVGWVADLRLPLP